MFPRASGTLGGCLAGNALPPAPPVEVSCRDRRGGASSAEQAGDPPSFKKLGLLLGADAMRGQNTAVALMA